MSVNQQADRCDTGSCSMTGNGGKCYEEWIWSSGHGDSMAQELWCYYN